MEAEPIRAGENEKEWKEERQGFKFEYSKEGYESDEEDNAPPPHPTHAVRARENDSSSRPSERQKPFDFYSEHEGLSIPPGKACPEGDITPNDINRSHEFPSSDRPSPHVDSLIRLRRCSSRFALSDNNCAYHLVDPAAEQWKPIKSQVAFRDMSASGVDCVYALGLQDSSLYHFSPSKRGEDEERFLRIQSSENLNIRQISAVDNQECLCLSVEGDALMFDGKHFINFGKNVRMICGGKGEIFTIGTDRKLWRLMPERRWEEVPVDSLCDMYVGDDGTLYGITSEDRRMVRLKLPQERDSDEYALEPIKEDDISCIMKMSSFCDVRPTLFIDRQGQMNV